MKITPTKLFFITIIFIIIGCHKNVSKEQNIKPNIILIMSDDHGWGDAGFNGSQIVQTPFMDDMAAQGVVFDRFYAASAVCSPTRASVMTGRNPLRMNVPYANTGHLKEQEITIAELLKAKGYATGHFGKWHLGSLTKDTIDAKRGGRAKYIQDYTIPTWHGYDDYFSTESKVPTHNPMLKPKVFEEGESERFGWKAIENTNETKYYGTAYWTGEGEKERDNLTGDDSKIIIDRVLPFIKSSQKEQKPFFTTIWFHTPHLPVVSDSVHRKKYKNLPLQQQIYYGAITAMDEQIGRLWKALKKNGLAENTLIFYCSDNGPERDTPGSAADFRERKRSLFEGGVRVPAFAVWGNKFKSAKRLEFPAVTSDYLPSILDLLGLEYPDERPLDGTSFIDGVKGEPFERDQPIGFICRNQVTWVNNRHKLFFDKKSKEYELYDLINDKGETLNVIEKHPGIFHSMKKELDAWLESVEKSKKGEDYDL